MIHQGAWIVWAACAGIVAMSTTNPFYLLPLFACAFAVQAMHRGDGPTARSFRIFLIAGCVTIVTRTALVLLGPVTSGSVMAAFFEGLRLAVLLAVFGAYNSVADPFAVLRLAPRRFHEPALAAALALSIAPRTISAVGRVREAQRLRGIRVGRLRSVPALAVPVLETGMEEALSLAESMDARGHGRGRRTRYRPDPWNLASWAIALTAVMGAGAFVARSFGSAADLGVTTFPLEWPCAVPVMVAAVIALAVPCVWPREARP